MQGPKSLSSHSPVWRTLLTNDGADFKFLKLQQKSCQSLKCGQATCVLAHQLTLAQILSPSQPVSWRAIHKHTCIAIFHTISSRSPTADSRSQDVSRSCDKAAIELLQLASSMRASCTSQSLNGVVVEPRLAATLALHLSRLQLTAFSEGLGRCCPLHVIFV